MKKSLIACATLAACLALPSFAQQQLTVVNFGGANANAQKKAFYEPYEKLGTKIVAVEYNGEQAKVKAMVEAKKVTWDEHSLFIDGKREIIWSGEFHPFRLPDTNVTAIVLSNNAAVNATAVGGELLAIYYGQPYTIPVPRTIVPMDPRAFDAYVGL